MTQPTQGGDGDALAAALARLVTRGTLTGGQARAVRKEFRAQLRHGPDAAAPGTAGRGATEPGPGATEPGTEPGRGAPRPPWSLLLAEIGGYVGGAFVFGAAAILLSDHWHELPTAARLGTLAVPALLLIAAAAVTARTAPGGWRARAERDPAPGISARRRLVSLLASVAAVLGGGAAAVLVDAGHGSGDWETFAFAWTALAIGLGAYLPCRTELLHTLLGMGAAASAVATLRVLGWYGERSTGWLFVLVGVGWGVATLRGLLAERGLGFGWAGVLVFVGAELLTATDPSVAGYAVLVLLAAAGLAGFTWGRSLTLLVIGVATLAVVVPQAVIDATDGALSSSGALLVIGLSIVGASVLGFRLHRPRGAAAPDVIPSPARGAGRH